MIYNQIPMDGASFSAEGPNMPLGLGMALAQNLQAMNAFSALPEKEKQRIIDGTHSIQSSKDMQAYVDSLAQHGMQG